MLRLKPSIVALAVSCVVVACSPTLDWREFVPEGSGLSVTFPCQPDRLARSVPLAGTIAPMKLLVCSAGDATFAVSFADVVDPARVGSALAELRAIAVANVQGREVDVVPLHLKGMTANEQAVRVALAGRLPGGVPVQEHAAFFSRGLRVYQATVIAKEASPQSVETFFGGLRFPM